jgi:hypothetical protein
MAANSTSIKKIIGLALLVIGVGLGYWAYQMSGSVGSQLTEAVTGSPTDKVMSLYIGGIASFVVGVFLFIKK